MKEPECPTDEFARLEALRAMALLDTPTEERYDRITRLAAHFFSVPIALVSIVDQTRQWFKSAQGLDAVETPRSISFCGHAILDNDIFEIQDALQDERFADNPLVTADPSIRFYAGAPLSTFDGYRIGTLCLIDRVPRALSADERQRLRDLADIVQSEFNQIEARKAIELLHNQEARLRAIVNTAIDGIFTIGESGLIETFNSAAERIFGYHRDEVAGQSIKMLMPECRLTAPDAHVVGTVREVTGRRKDGGAFPMELAISETQLGDRVLFTGIIRDISARRNAVHTLAERDSMQKAILHGASYAIIATDTNGLITVFNAAAENMLGYSAAEMIGQETPECVHAPEEVEARAAELSAELGMHVPATFNAVVGKTARMGLVDEREWTLVRKNGDRLPVRLSITALRDEHEEISGYVGIASDLTEQKMNERIKSEFISTVSHELRTPLTSIRGSLGLIVGGVAGELPERAATLIDVAHRNSERLVRLINDILDIEKVESGKMTFNLNTQPLLPVLNQAIDASRGYARELGVSFRLDGDGEHIDVRIDSDRLVQVFTNLLANAAKFSPQGEQVVIAVHKLHTHIRVTVSDHGPGIPAEFHHRIFQKFSQADASDTRQKGGTGLGLAISRSLVEAMQGAIGFDSSPSGTCFWVELPVSPPQSDTPRCSNGERILVCDDDPEIAGAISTLLTNAGYCPEIAPSAAEAKVRLRQNTYDAMTLDIALPDQDGISLIRELRTEYQAGQLPIIVVSGAHTAGGLSFGGDLAIADWIEKPFDDSRLLVSLKGALCDTDSSTDLSAAPARILHVEDDHDVHQFVEALVDETAKIDHAFDLQAARTMLDENDYEAVILDLGLPDGSGWTLLPFIAAKRPEPRVVVFSAHELSDADTQHFAAALVKSNTDNARLLSTLKTHIARNKKRSS